ncbi:MAG: MFS transporter, partial [Burkholderiales bacterium]
AYSAGRHAPGTSGLPAANGVGLGLRSVLGVRGFEDWGWRVPFLMSVMLLPLSIWVRLRLRESPAFERLRSAGRLSPAPLADAYGTRRMVARAGLALLGLTAGQAVLWYTGQLYALGFLQTAAGVGPRESAMLMAVALLLALPTFVVFGALSDRIGRRPLVVVGCLLAASLYVPIFGALIDAANPGHAEAQRQAPIVVHADPGTCRLQFDPLGIDRDLGTCDLVRRHLARRGLGYEREALPEGLPPSVTVGDRTVDLEDLRPGDADALRARLDGALRIEGYPDRADPDRIDRVEVVALLWLLVAIAAMVYAPVAATLAELFPTRVRCTAIALPYHLGNGWFGGFLPAIAAASVAARGEALAGLGFPIAVALVTAVVALVALPETKDRDLDRIE